MEIIEQKTKTSKTTDAAPALRQHVLLNPLVLATLSPMIPLQDLLQFRLVCKTWNEFAVPLIQEKTRLAFYGNWKMDVIDTRIRFSKTSYNAKFLRELGSGAVDVFMPPKYNHSNKVKEYKYKCRRLEEFLQVMKGSQKLPVVSYSIHSLFLFDNLMEEFWTICGPSIKSLNLDVWKMHSQQLRELLDNKLPLLESFVFLDSMNQVTKPRDDDLSLSRVIRNLKNIHLHKNAAGSKFVQELVKAAPAANITYFYMHNIDKQSGLHASEWGRGSARHLETLVKLDYHQQVTEMKFYDTLQRYHWKLLLQLGREGMRLTKFSYTDQSEISNDLLEAFLATQRHSLEQLVIQGVFEERPIQIPPMAALKRVRLAGFEEHLIHLSSPICYRDTWPNLTKLSLMSTFNDGRCSDLENFLPRNEPPRQNLKVLELPLADDPLFIRRFGLLFPRVKTLKINQVDPVAYPAIWLTWPELEELHLQLNLIEKSIDSSFTGIPVKSCERILKYKLYTKPKIEIPGSGSSICNLRKLKKLVVEIATNYCLSDGLGPYHLTDVTGYWAFAEMSQLKELIVGHSKISSKCRAQIQTKLAVGSTIDIGAPYLGRMF